ncbi:MAG TPA: peroxiredoxin [Rhizomicrobium sp.]|jgi:peroxiredoxin Q/BCP|nr:peroxiredoxin [Rhizomicrobium sp.]
MKKHLVLGLLAAFAATPALAALKPGDMAPDFTAQGSLGGQPFTFHLKDALKKGPVVVYFYPSAYTGGCDLEAHTFAEQSDKFAAAGASIIGVSADDLTRLKRFSADPNFCAGKFPIASDADTKIATSYNLNVGAARDGAKDVNQDVIGHAFIERVTYVVGKDGKIMAVMSSKDDKLTPDQHVDKSLAIVAAAK